MEPHKKHRTGTEHHHAELQDISWHNKGGVGTLSLQQLYNKKYKTTTNKGTNREQQRNGGLGAAPCSKIILQCFYKKTTQFITILSEKLPSLNRSIWSCLYCINFIQYQRGLLYKPVPHICLSKLWQSKVSLGGCSDCCLLHWIPIALNNIHYTTTALVH